MLPYAHHLDVRSFSFPNAFWPERWLVASDYLPLSDALARLPSIALRGSPPSLPRTGDGFAFVHDENAFLAFSHGPMNCVGRGFAMQEMRTVVVALMQQFRVRAATGFSLEAYERETKDFFVSTRPRITVVLEVRTSGGSANV